MFGNNPIRPPEKGDGTTLDVVNIFATLQGEGIYAGFPAVFIRLSGCNLACSFCDTEFETFNKMAVADIVKNVVQLANNDEKRVRNLVVITGGEPFRQPIEKLCEELLFNDFKIQIETNGTLYRKLPDTVEIICSPKNTGNGYFPIREDLLARINAFKFIISAHDENYANIAEIGQADKIPVYVQPMDEHDEIKNHANLQLAAKLALENGYRLSLQIHKLLGIE